jgi:hypothetical protein
MSQQNITEHVGVQPGGQGSRVRIPASRSMFMGLFDKSSRSISLIDH